LRIGKLSLFILVLTLVLLSAPFSAHGQQPGKVYRIGRLGGGPPPAPANTTPGQCPIKGSPTWQAFLEGLRARGYVEGENLTVECRYTDGKTERAPAFATELVNLKPDVIIAANTNQVWALKNVTSTIPVVMHSVIEPVRRGLVASLARPGGNVTGLTDDAGLEIIGKYLELLKQAVPTATRFASLQTPGVAAGGPSIAWGSIVEAEARTLGVKLQTYDVRVPEELEGAFAAMTKARAEALLVVPSPFSNYHSKRIVDLAARHRLPAMYPDRSNVEDGGLMAYAVDELEIARRLAAYVDRILKGANPGDLPVEQPTKFELLINLRTAKALGLTIPQSLLMRADEVIE
jgi:putative ABC transport system substrate-binding protein